MALRLAQLITNGIILKAKFLSSIQWCNQQTFDFKNFHLSDKSAQTANNKNCNELKKAFVLPIKEKERKRNIRLKKRLNLPTLAKPKVKPVVKLPPMNNQVTIPKPPDIRKYFSEYKSRHMKWQPSKLAPFGQKGNFCHKLPEMKKVKLVYPNNKKFKPGK